MIETGISAAQDCAAELRAPAEAGRFAPESWRSGLARLSL